MIVYKLKCASGHVFEGWFKNIKSFDRQKRSSLVNCPVCGYSEIEKVITSTRALKSKGKESSKMSDEAENWKHDLFRKISEKVRLEFENVGDKFFVMARKIHFEEIPAKNIYGTTTKEEEETLMDEGVEFFKFPMIKEPND